MGSANHIANEVGWLAHGLSVQERRTAELIAQTGERPMPGETVWAAAARLASLSHDQLQALLVKNQALSNQADSGRHLDHQK